MLILSSPSGAGKSTISRLILEQNPHLNMSVSATTRPPRPGEVDGEHYYFVSREKFDEMAKNGEFLEHATVFGNSYGTPRKPVEDMLEAGVDVLFDVDWQGTQQLVENAPMDVVSIFILPPSIEELERRLRDRNQDSDEVVEARMAKATSEMSHWSEYDYIIINVTLEVTVPQVQAILEGERLKRIRRTGLSEFLRRMGVGQ